ncbi:MAG: hypothetical protein IPK17_21305 [Chloroflexi bacterium]|uniref:hypothetical protein n=1 Tax=Candidatus Flexifilum breve TaxID=3140694 RepID=UPI003135D9CE|nr:hypothetical protein [Chloroflexota bacterium]
MGFARQYQQLRQAGVLAHMTSEARHALGAEAMKVDSLFDLLHSAAIIQDGVDGECPAGTDWVAIEDQAGKRGYIAVTPDQKPIVANIFKLL